MNELFPFIYKNLWALIVLITPIVCFIWYKIKYKYVTDLILPFCAIGIILTAIGAALSNATASTEQTINALMLKELNVAAKFIPIGYIFILFSLIAMVDSVFDKIFKIKNDNKT